MSTETPETAMRPEDVPADLVQLVRLALDGLTTRNIRAILVAVLPAHEAMVRARVAEEILAEAATGSLNASEYGSHKNVLEAARIARGEQP